VKQRKDQVLVFASGDETGGGSGFQELSNFQNESPVSMLKSLASFLTPKKESL